MDIERMTEILDYLSERVYDECGETLPEIQTILDALSDEEFHTLNHSAYGLNRYVESALARLYPAEYAAI